MVHHYDERGGLMIASHYEPTEGEIVKVLQEFDLPVSYTMQLIKDRNPKTEMVLIDTKKYEEHLKEVGLR